MNLINANGALHGSVAANEILFRGVKPNPNYLAWKEGRWQISALAFTDPSYRISVDRAVLCGHDPRHAQVHPTDCVCSVAAAAVRAISAVVQRDVRGRIVQAHSILIGSDPLTHNPAHAVIYADPQITTRNVFRKLQESLALLAQWEIQPPTPAT